MKTTTNSYHRISFLTLKIAILLTLTSCNDDDEIYSSLTLTGWTSKVTLYVAGIEEPLFSESELTANSDDQISISPLLPDSYKIEYYVIASGNEYWPIPKVKVFQLMPNEQKTLELD